MKLSKYFILILLGLFPSVGWAQSKSELAGFYAEYQLDIVIWVAVLVSVLALLSLMVALYALRAVIKIHNPEVSEAPLIAVKPGEEGVGFWRRFWNRMNDSVPVAKEETVLTNHSYDGIRELDNRLPPWWLYGFYVTILFGAIYLLNYHVFKSAPMQAEEYDREMAEAKAQVEAYLATLDDLIDETNVEFSMDQTDLAAGMEIFQSKCSACHGQQGEGGVGPNFADQYWIHGGDAKSMFKVIKYGVPAKGMISWQSQLSPKQMQQVSSYILTLEGTNPPNQKEPQGALFERVVEEGEDQVEAIEAGI